MNAKQTRLDKYDRSHEGVWSLSSRGEHLQALKQGGHGKHLVKTVWRNGMLVASLLYSVRSKGVN